ncbi:GNAT family N-acetyltransferase [Streptomyces sp. CoH17]|uniref:GNAT family N-acetyltransferase n=1 Tax=Streptomyces sp. CoH17 TaxID=2992806 RepID=UPI00226EEF01|nr:GNAT family N-acetyltransferase [Streptomyces sp. CoH17]
MRDVTIRLAKPDECEEIQKIFNAPENGQYLGGFTQLEPIKSKQSAGSLAVAVEFDGTIVGANEVSTKHDHRLQMQLVAVHPDYKQSKIATALYTYWAIKAALNGRYMRTDTIIGDNPIMPQLLPTLGFKPGIVERGKVRRHHSLTQWVHSFLEDDPRFDRCPNDFKFEIEKTEKDDKNFADVCVLLHKQGRMDDTLKLAELREWVVEEFVG